MKRRKMNFMDRAFAATGIIMLIILLFILIVKIPSSNQTLSMGTVDLNVRDKEIMKAFYSDLVGLKVMGQTDKLIELGDNGKILIRLFEETGFSDAPTGEAGLYHTALVFSERSRLAQVVNEILAKQPDLYQGSSDHLVTEAFYFADPEGNGVELYFDRPRSEWKYDANGKPLMGSEYINERGYINMYMNGDGSKSVTDMGHVHLKVGDIALAKGFYVDNLKFDLIMENPSALFISRDGYHHNIGMNTWESAGAGKRSLETYGLRSYEIIVHSSQLFEQIQSNLFQNSIEHNVENNMIDTRDPFGTVVKIRLV